MPRRIESQMLIYKRIAERLKEIRKQRHLSYVQVGRMIGVSYQQIQKYEKLQNRIPGGKIICAQFGFECAVFLFFGRLTIHLTKLMLKK